MDHMENYFNILFFSILGLSLIFGFIKGYKKGLYWLIVMTIFYAFFFLTIDQVVGALWNLDIPNLGKMFKELVPEAAGASSFKEAVPLLTENYLRDSLGDSATNAELIAFAEGIGLFVFKLIYAILYFTVFYLVYKFFFWIIRLIFLRTNREEPQLRLLGAAFGFCQGVLSVFMMLTLLGGYMDITQNALALVPEDEEELLESQEYEIMSETVEGFNSNLIVSLANKMEVKDKHTGLRTPLHLSLFDTVFSFNYHKDHIALRKELSLVSDMVRVYMNSDYRQTENISDIKDEEIESIFTSLSQSDLVTSIIPLGIELTSEHYDMELPITKEQLYAIKWDNEVKNLGEVASVSLTLLQEARLTEEDVNYDEITIDGATVQNIFNQLADSEIISNISIQAVSPLLKKAHPNVKAIITLPEGVHIDTELQAMGAIAKAILDTEISVGDMKSSDPMRILRAASAVDYTILLESKVASQALVNMLSGAGDLKELRIIEVPENIEWYDTVDEYGTIIEEGELRNILQAINTILPKIDSIDPKDYDLSLVQELDDDAIDALLDSRVLTATVSVALEKAELGSAKIVLSNSIYDEEGYIKSSELKSLVKSARLAFTKLYCETCESKVDLNKLTTLTETEVDELLSSDIIVHTLGHQMKEYTDGVLVIPQEVQEELLVNLTTVESISRDELKRLLLAATSLKIADLENFDVNASVLKNLSLEGQPSVLDEAKINLILDSKIIHATLSDLLLQVASDVPQIIIPEYSENHVLVREVLDEIEYVRTEELVAMTKAVLAIDLQDFNDLNSISLQTTMDQMSLLMESAIFHATLSERLFELEVLRIPNSVRVDVSDVTFVSSTEIEALLDSLEALNLTDFETFDFSATTLLNPETELDFDRILTSAILEVTISEQILNLSLDETAPVGSMSLIIPTALREDTPVGTEAIQTIEEQELKDLLNAIIALGLTNFNEVLNPATIADLDLDTLLLSGSVHYTIHQMILNNGAIEVPDLATETLYDIPMVTTVLETKKFIEAVNTFLSSTSQSGDFTTISFDFNTIRNIDEVERNIILDSMIVRNVITDQVEAIVPPFYTIDPSYYENSDPTTFFTKDGINNVIADLEAISL